MSTPTSKEADKVSFWLIDLKPISATQNLALKAPQATRQPRLDPLRREH